MIFANSARIKPHDSTRSAIGAPIAGQFPGSAHDCRPFSPNALARLRVLLLGALAGAAAGCGFQLQGAGVLPEVVATTYVEVPQRFTEFHLRLTDALTSRGVELTESREEAGAVLRILEDESGQRVLSVSARNTPQEYEVFYAVGFSLEAGGTALIDDEFLVATRSYSYDPTQVLGMSAEEQVLREALAEDLARRVLRRIEGVQPAATAALISQ